MKPVRVKFGKRVVVFRHAQATAATKAARVRAGKRLARMWTKAERMANLRKAWKANGVHVKSNPSGFGQKIVFENGQVRILHTVTTNGSAFYIVDRDTNGKYQTTTAIAVSKSSPLMPAAAYISKEGPPWKRAVKGWHEFLQQKSNPSRSAAGKKLARAYGFFRKGDAIYQRRPGQPAKLIRRL